MQSEWWMDNQTAVHSYNKLLLNNKKGWTLLCVTYTQQHSQITNALYSGLQQLKFCTSNARGEGTVTDWGTKISHAMWHGQEN